MLEFLRNLFAYDKWAIDRSLGTLREPQNSRAQAMLSHILLAEKIWLTRLRGEDPTTINVFEELPLAECVRLSAELNAAYLQYIDSLTESDLSKLVSYETIKGDPFQTPIKDILTHVGIHGAYHRGQIAMLVRDGGGTAIGTDYILFTRV